MKRYLMLTFLFSIHSGVVAKPEVSPDCLQTRATEFQELSSGRQNTILFDSEIETNWLEWENFAKQATLLSEAFKTKGIQLIIVPVPTRVMVNPQLLDTKNLKQKNYASQQPNVRFKRFIDSLQKNRVSVINLLGPLRTGGKNNMRPPAFFSKDFHWTQAGALIASAEISERITKALPGITEKHYSIVSTGQKYLQPLTPIKKLNDLCKNPQEMAYASFVVMNDDTLALLNFEEEESDGKNSWKWSAGESVSMAYVSSSEVRRDLSIEFSNFIRDQLVSLSLNGKEVYNSGRLKAADFISAKIPLNLVVGMNKMTFKFSKWNHKDLASTFAEKDTRKLSVSFSSIGIDDKERSTKSTSPGLLDDYTPPVTLIGTSYSNYMQVSELLKGMIDSDVLNFTQVSGGIYNPMFDYIKTLKDNGPMAIIWEIPMMWSPEGANSEIPKMIEELK